MAVQTITYPRADLSAGCRINYKKYLEFLHKSY